MKTGKSLITLILLLATIFSANAQDLNTALKKIKIGNSLREAHHYDLGEKYLITGLSAVRKNNNKYWEAVACEYLGLLYRDINDYKSSMQYFNTSLELYTSLNMDLSMKVVKDLMNSYDDADEKVDNSTQNKAEYFAGIEVGSKGVKYSIIREFEKNGIYSFASVKDGSNNVQTISLTDYAITETGDAVKAFFDTIQHYRVSISPDKVFIAVSSGVKQETDKNQQKEEQLRNAIQQAVPMYKKKIEFLSASQEAQLTTLGTVPLKFMYSSTTVDIGSGNTKGGYFQDKDNYNPFQSPWGSVSFSKKFADKTNKVATALSFYNDSIKSGNKGLQDELSRKPGFKNKKFCFIIGGAPWALTNYLYPEKIKEDFVEITAGDIERYYSLATNDYEKLISPDLSRIGDEEILKDAKKQIARTQSTFTQDQIIAGAIILKGVIDEMQNAKPKKHFYFARNGYIGWISGYIVKQVSENYDKVKVGE